MKTIPITISLLMILFSCSGQQTNNHSVSSKNQLKAFPIRENGSGAVTGAILLPSSWTCQASSEIRHEGLLSTYQLILGSDATSGIEFRFQDLNHFLYNAQHVQFANEMGFPLDASTRPYTGIKEYTQEFILPMIHEDYQLTDQQILNNFYLNPKHNSNSDVLLTSFVSRSNPDRVGFLYTVIFFSGTEYDHAWITNGSFFEGRFEQATELYELAKLIYNSYQLNPMFEQSLNKINQQMIRDKQISFEQQQQAIRSVNDHFYNTLHSIQQQSSATYNNTSQQFSNMMFDVESYVNPNSGEQYQLPSRNEYYFENSLGDFISSDNPLFDPNSNLSSIYNWQKLEKQ